jgi:AcrR family transcriptional regulator
MAIEPGLRERKKEQTRALIAERARRLFAERGFDQVPVSDIARAADVSVGTVFNYFPSKEDLVYGRMEAFEEEMLEALRNRPPRESIIDAFARFVLEPRGLLASENQGDAEFLVAITKMIAESPALLAREREVYERYTRALAEQIAREAGSGPEDAEPWVIANALIGVHRALIDTARRGVLAGTPNRRVAREVQTQGLRALARLKAGLGEPTG